MEADVDQENEVRRIRLNQRMKEMQQKVEHKLGDLLTDEQHDLRRQEDQSGARSREPDDVLRLGHVLKRAERKWCFHVNAETRR